MEYLFQFDTEFISANTSVKKITTLREFYNKSLSKFKEGCQLAQIVEKEENSLEDCVAALKKNIGEGAKLKVKDINSWCLENEEIPVCQFQQLI